MLQSIQKTCLTTVSLWLLTSLFSIPLAAQQLPIFTKYRDLLTVINPGAIPIDYFVYDNESSTFVGATWRDQWQSGNFKRPPSTKILRADYFASDIGSGGIVAGGYVMQDSYGIFETTGFYGKIANVIDLYAGELSLGLTIGYVLNNLEFRPVGIIDNFSDAYPDVGFGIFYRQEFQRQGFFYTGLSVPQLNGFRHSSVLNNTAQSIKRTQHYYYTFGFLNYFVDNSFIEPSIWVKYVPNVPISVDFNIRAQLADRLSIGTGFSTQSNLIHLTIELLQKWEGGLLKIGFGYSHPLTNYSSIFGGSHEYNFNYNF